MLDISEIIYSLYRLYCSVLVFHEVHTVIFYFLFEVVQISLFPWQFKSFNNLKQTISRYLLMVVFRCEFYVIQTFLIFGPHVQQLVSLFLLAECQLGQIRTTTELESTTGRAKFQCMMRGMTAVLSNRKMMRVRKMPWRRAKAFPLPHNNS